MAGFHVIKKYPGLVTLIALEFLLLLIISYQFQVSRRVDVLEKSTLMILGPVQELNETIVGGVSRVFQNQKTRAELLDENAKLAQALRGYEQMRIQLEESRRENERLRNLLSLEEENGWRYVPARVIGRANRRNDYMITINKGERGGLRPDMGVFCPQGVVGVIWEVSGGYAKVMTVNNPSSVVAALVQNTRYQESYVSGNDLLDGRLINFPNFESLEVGDLVLTSGLDGIFPKGLHIGRVTRARPSSYLFQEVALRFATDFSRLEEVVVLIPDCDEEAADEHE